MFFLYSWRYPKALVALLQKHEYKIVPFLRAYWGSTNLQNTTQKLRPAQTQTFQKFVKFLIMGIIAEIVAGIACIVAWKINGFAGGLAFGLALLIGYPVVWAHLLALPVWASYLLYPKRTGRQIVCKMLERQVVELRKKHKFSVVAVVGSVGKTSTKVAIAKTVGVGRRVVWDAGNYNDRVTVPLVLFGHTLPALFNVVAWFSIWLRNRQIIAGDYPYDVAVLELGTDGPGQIADFAYLKPDIVVVTGIAPEHMEYFGTLEAVAHEELTALTFSKKALINVDDSSPKFLIDHKFASYGLHSGADYYASNRKELAIDGQSLRFHLGKAHAFAATIPTLGVQGAKIAVAAAAVAHILGMSNDEVEQGVTAIEAFAGRMRILPGKHESTIIDDTYNASPIAVKAALDVLYATKSFQRIAVLGSMNELGEYSAEAHREVGAHCDPKKLDLVITIGTDAAAFLAPAAEEQGCKVITCKSPYAAAQVVEDHVKKGALILAKGSQNGVFAEEAVKMLLADPNDITKLVRQGPSWLKKKAAQFSDGPAELYR